MTHPSGDWELGIVGKFQRGETILNGWLSIPDAFTAELMASAGWDSLTIDLQHGLQDYRSALAILQALQAHDCVPLARVPSLEDGIIGKLLDAGAYGIICPMVNSAEEARALAAACRYFPEGQRSSGPIRAGLYAGSGYHPAANGAVAVLPQIETVEALGNLDAILATPGVTGVYVGPGDLAITMGLGPGFDRDDPPLLDAFRTVIDAARRHGKIAAMHTHAPEFAARMFKLGFAMVTASSDATLVASGARDVVRRARPRS